MKAHSLSMVCIAGLLLMDLMLGCDSADLVGPPPITYETVVFGTFRGIKALISLDGSTFGSLSLDTTSYIHIEKSDMSYSIKLHGTDLKTHTLSVSFEEVGHIQIKDVTYHSAEGYRAAHWDGYIMFTPDTALHRSLWTLLFYVNDSSMSDVELNVSYPESSSIFLGQDNGYLRLGRWTKYSY
jgi:hypothetical protein